MPAKFGMQFKVSGLVFPQGAKAMETGVPALPEFLWKPDAPQYAWYKKGRDTAFAKAEERVAAIMQDSLRKYHTSTVYPYGRSLQSIRTRMLPATKSDNSPLGRRIWVGYQPRASENRDTVTDRGVTSFMMSTIYGVMPGRIHPPWYGPWSKTKSDVGAIYGSNEFAGFPGGRLGHWAASKGMLPMASSITKQQQRPRGSRYYSRQRFGGKVYENEYSTGLKAGTIRRPGRPATHSAVKVQEYIPLNRDEWGTTGRISQKKTNIHWHANMFLGQHSYYKGKIVPNKDITVRMEKRKTASGGTKTIRITKRGSVPIPKHGGFAEQEKLRKLGTGAISDKTWENMAKFIALSLEKKGKKPNPVLMNWYEGYILNGTLMEECQAEYYDAIEQWNDYAINQWKKHVYNINRQQFAGEGRGIFGGGRSGLLETTGPFAKSATTLTSGLLYTGKFKGKFK